MPAGLLCDFELIEIKHLEQDVTYAGVVYDYLQCLVFTWVIVPG